MNPIICLIFGLLIGSSVKCIPLTDNQIRDEIKFLSQDYDLSKPSRLRSYLIADLKKALSKVKIIVALKVNFELTTNVFIELLSTTRNGLQCRRRS